MRWRNTKCRCDPSARNAFDAFGFVVRVSVRRVTPEKQCAQSSNEPWFNDALTGKHVPNRFSLNAVYGATEWSATIRTDLPD